MTKNYLLQRLVVVWLLCLALGSCQRASYSCPAVPVTSVVAALRTDTVSQAAAPGRALVADGRRVSFRDNAAARSRNWPRSVRPRVGGGIPKRRVALRPRASPGARVATHSGRAAASRCTTLAAGPEQNYSKAVAVLLAILLGFLGAHLFYLGHWRQGFSYLAFTLLCAAIVVLAIPIANLAVGGSGFGAVIVGLYILLLGLGGIAVTYVHALVDAVRIIIGKLQPASGTFE